jgi:hypothetical protein
VHIVETQQRHAAHQPTTPAPSAVELRRELADANANCAAADRVAKRAKDIADKARCFAQKQRTTSSGLRLIWTPLRSEPLSRITPRPSAARH